MRSTLVRTRSSRTYGVSLDVSSYQGGAGGVRDERRALVRGSSPTFEEINEEADRERWRSARIGFPVFACTLSRKWARMGFSLARRRWRHVTRVVFGGFGFLRQGWPRRPRATYRDERSEPRRASINTMAAMATCTQAFAGMSLKASAKAAPAKMTPKAHIGGKSVAGKAFLSAPTARSASSSAPRLRRPPRRRPRLPQMRVSPWSPRLLGPRVRPRPTTFPSSRRARLRRRAR